MYCIRFLRVSPIMKISMPTRLWLACSNYSLRPIEELNMKDNLPDSGRYTKKGCERSSLDAIISILPKSCTFIWM